MLYYIKIVFSMTFVLIFNAALDEKLLKNMARKVTKGFREENDCLRFLPLIFVSRVSD